MTKFLPYCLILFILLTSSCQEEPSNETTSSTTSSGTTSGESKEYSNDPSKVSVTGGYHTDFNFSTMKGYANLTSELKAGARIGIEYSKYSDMTNPTRVTISSLDADNSYSIELSRINIGTKLYYRSFVQHIASGFYEYGEIRSFVWRTIEIPTSGAVDLGLSVKWAACDLGTSSPTSEYGDYYAWGETTSKTNFTKSNYKYYSNNKYTKYNATDNKMILDLSDDAAHAQLGGKWRIPTRWEFEELTNALHNLCTVSQSSGAPNNKMKCYSGVMYKNTEGRLYVNQDPKYSNIAIFTPEDTYYIMVGTSKNKNFARTWCSTTQWYYYCLKNHITTGGDNDLIDFCYFHCYDSTGGSVERWKGLKIRPVWDDKILK